MVRSEYVKTFFSGILICIAHIPPVTGRNPGIQKANFKKSEAEGTERMLQMLLQYQILELQNEIMIFQTGKSLLFTSDKKVQVFTSYIG